MDWQTIANIATAVTLLLAIIVFGWQVRVYMSERAYAKSEFALRSALEGFEQSLNLLSNGNNDRVTWIAATRILERARRVAQSISIEVHRNVYEIQLERYRRSFSEFLGFNSPEKVGAFFYGATDIFININEAAEEATRRNETPQGSKPTIKSIPEGALWIVWNFAQFSEPCDDQISGKFPKEVLEKPSMRIFWPGLYDYLSHIRSYHSVEGRLIKKRNVNS